MSTSTLKHSASLRELAASLFEENPVLQLIDEAPQGQVAVPAQSSIPATTDEPAEPVQIPAE
ncbi:hypothetical protein [Roseibium sp. SCP14]|uniref:hypothetical protein n=1 Tax=Roseibium sp. SCP14 TaxID=3141375 RepID=UPI003336378C